ncbi:MAG: ArsB/NhaD family transporter [Candidatus Bathyarchaeia archaeon]
MSPINQETLAITIFMLTYILIATGYKERTIASIAGVTALWAAKILTRDEMLGYVNFEALGLLFGMMIVIGALREAGFFRWLGLYLADICKYNSKLMLIIFSLTTGFLSAFLDNVTTILFMVSVTIDIAEILKLNPKPYIITQVLASNIGGTATLIGDPPNIMIASAGNLTFIDFLLNTAPISFLNLLILIFLSTKYYKKEVNVKVEALKIPIKPSEVISDKRLFKIGILVFCITIFLLTIHHKLSLSPSIIVLLAASFILLIGGEKMPRILEDVEWNTLIFFGCLFIIVGGLEKVGVIQKFASYITLIINHNSLIAVTLILWSSALISSAIDNIPLAASFIPLLKGASKVSGIPIYSLWWALALGCGFGGNGTIIGASANIIAIGLSRRRGVLITFKEFAKIGIIILLITVATVNLLLILKSF